MIFLKTFKISGIRKNYEVNCYYGLNVIFGARSTVKPSIFELY